MKTSRRIGWLVVLVLLVAGYAWHRREPTAVPAPATSPVESMQPGQRQAESRPSAPAAAPRFAVAADGGVTIPPRFRLPGVDRVLSAPSYKEWLAQYPAYQQAKINAFNDAHFGVYRVNSREQVAWMAQNGYPMPEDVLAAEGMNDAALLALAEQGNDKAGFLLQERRAAELAAYLAKGGTRSDYFNGLDGERRSRVNMELRQLMERSNSPYKGYAQASEALSGIYADPKDIDVQAIAGLYWARNLGDSRADQLIQDYVGSDSRRQLIWYAAASIGINDSISMSCMEESGGRRAGVPRGMGIPGNGAPVP